MLLINKYSTNNRNKKYINIQCTYDIQKYKNIYEIYIRILKFKVYISRNDSFIPYSYSSLLNLYLNF